MIAPVTRKEPHPLDFANIAMLACTFGCDALFEHGFIGVEPGGAPAISPLAAANPGVSAHIKHHLDGRSTAWWTAAREPYFKWHRTNTFKVSPPQE